MFKIFKDEKSYEIEKKIFKEYTQRGIESKHIVKPVLCNDTKLAIVLEPLGRPLRLEKLTKDRIKQMFKCVEELHKNGLIHRDLSPTHFYIRTETNLEEIVFVIDLGCAIFMDEEIRQKALDQSDIKEDSNEKKYAGSVQFAANDILDVYLEE